MCVASAGQAIDCTLASLANGASYTVMVTYSVASSVAPDRSEERRVGTACRGNTFRGPATVAITRNVTLPEGKLFKCASVDAGSGGHTVAINLRNAGPSAAASLHIPAGVGVRVHLATGVHT